MNCEDSRLVSRYTSDRASPSSILILLLQSLFHNSLNYSEMRTSTTLAALAGLASTAIAQGSEHTLQSKTGFSSTRIFAPFGVGGAMVTPLGASGPNNATTTWGAVVASIMIDNPETSFTLGPNTAVYTNTRFG